MMDAFPEALGFLYSTRFRRTGSLWQIPSASGKMTTTTGCIVMSPRRCCTGNRLSQIMTRAFKDSSAFASGTKPGGDGTAAKTSEEARESRPLAALRDSPFPKLVASELRVSDSEGAAEVFV